MEKLSNTEAELRKSIAYKKTCNNDRADTLKCSIKKVFLENVIKSTGKYLHRSLFLSNVSGLPWHRYFPVNFAEILRALFLVTTSNGCFFQMSPNLKRRRTEPKKFTNELEIKQNIYSKLLFLIIYNIQGGKNVNVICKDLVFRVARKQEFDQRNWIL